MLGEGAHVQHDKFWLTKHLRIDALKDKVLFSFRIQGYQEGVIDVAIPIFLDICDLALWFELVCNGNTIVQGLPLVLGLLTWRQDELT